MTDLGNLGLSSFGFAINSGGQIVGHSRINDGSFRAFIWEKGGPMVDLNTLVSPASSVVLVDPYYINDRGYIAVAGVLPNGNEHAFVLVPGGSCDETCEGRIAASQNSATSAQYLATRTRESEARVGPASQLRNRLGQRYHSTLPIVKNDTPGQDGIVNQPVPNNGDSGVGPVSGTPLWLEEKNPIQDLDALIGTGIGGGCVVRGGQCYPQHNCCPGLKCVPASVRAFCR